MLRLVVTAENRRRVFRFDVPHRDFCIGSAQDNDVVLGIRGVSRHHAVCSRRDQSLVIRDLRSKNGIVTNGRRVEEATLTPGMSVQVGAALMRLEEISTSDAELAIRIDRDSSSSASLLDERGDTSSVLSRDRSAGPLQWARQAEEGNCSRAALLEFAREILGADSLIVFSGTGDDIALLDVAGRLPDADESKALIDAAAAKGNVVGNWLLAMSQDSVVAAVRCESTAAWRREFLEFVLYRLHGSVAHEPVHPSSSGALILPPGMIAGSSRASRALIEQLSKIAPAPFDVLITGETGTGKELVARCLHENGLSPKGPFIAVNCAAVAAEILEAELFGIVRGAATGVSERPGLFLEAHGGTIFLDEIGDMAERLQAKLLRVLQEREVMPVGSAKARRINVRVISSTNHDLQALVAEGRFRADLYYRIRGAVIHVPPLRERRDDIAALALAFATESARKMKKRIAGLSARAVRRLVAYEWPGNVRDLKHVIERAVIACSEKAAIENVHVDLLSTDTVDVVMLPSPDGTLQAAERSAIADALRRTAGKKKAAAKLLGITRSALYAKMKRYRLN